VDCGLWSKVLHDTHEHIDWYVEFDFVCLSSLWRVCRLPRFSLSGSSQRGCGDAAAYSCPMGRGKGEICIRVLPFHMLG
jgi:hypothetical protein